MKRLNIDIDKDFLQKLKLHALYENVTLRVFLTRIIIKEISRREKEYGIKIPENK